MTVAELEQKVADGRAVLATLAPTDPRYARGAAKVAAWETERQRLREEGEPLVHRYPWSVRWARERGVLEVRDVFTGAWLQINASDAPEPWRWAATKRAREERAQRGAA